MKIMIVILLLGAVSVAGEPKVIPLGQGPSRECHANDRVTSRSGCRIKRHRIIAEGFDGNHFLC